MRDEGVGEGISKWQASVWSVEREIASLERRMRRKPHRRGGECVCRRQAA